VAVVAMAGVFPGAHDLDRFWANVAAGADCSSEPPPGRWLISSKRAHDRRLGVADKVYSTRGYFVERLDPDLDGLDIDHGLVTQLDPLFQLVLHVGGRAFRNACLTPVDRTRIGVCLGNIALPTEKISRLAWEYCGGAFHQALGLREPSKTHALNRFVAGFPAVLLARALRLGGEAFCLDAACASSLYAIKLAIDALLEGRADAMLAGGVARPDCLYTQMGFAQLRALSLSGRCSPFDAGADGLMVGEGCGIFVLKRLADALAHGERILGVIAGIGLSNDVDGNLLAPASEGHLRAMRAAYRQAGWSPRDVDLIECHATGTPVGDAVEFSSLLQLWQPEPAERGACVIGSVKSTVGHLLTGAGAAGLAKLLLALQYQALPPSANFRRPSDQVRLQGSPFRILPGPEAWERRQDGIPRRAAISGFGFGGINAHLLIEEWIESRPHTLSVAFDNSPPEAIAIVGMAARVGSLSSLDALRGELFSSQSASDSPCDFTSRVDLSLDRFRIPPKELEELLPQQLLALLAADQAIGDVRGTAGNALAARTGIVLGVNLDCNTTNFHLRWAAGEAADAALAAHPDRERLIAQFKDAASPPLTANRTMGALASVAASRIARHLRAGGPSFTVSDDGDSGLRALEVALGMLRRGEVDQAVVGAVDLGGDERNLRACREVADQSPDHRRRRGSGVKAPGRCRAGQRPNLRTR
jgi:acyl transferase domain-containing protein